MRRLFLSITLCASLLCANAQRTDYRVVPLPQRIEYVKGEPFVMSRNTVITYDAQNDKMKRNALFLAEYVAKAAKLNLAVADKSRKEGGEIRLVIDPEIPSAEGYRISVGKKLIIVAGKTSAGVFYGIQTIRKSLPVQSSGEQVVMPAVKIADSPRFGYRGMMLDCSRHFFPVEFVKRYIDLIALHNMNVFHWHLSDDQGWRIEIKSHPQLAQISSKRSGTVIGHNSMVDDSTAHGGIYTQNEVREIVEYARERNITVIPEIDMPGHMLAVLAAYPELGCTGGPYEVGHKWGVYTDVLCLGNEKIYPFLQDIIDELIELFPAKYIHIGGDETPTQKWTKCSRCTKLAGEQGINVEHLQSYFTNRIEQYVNSKGKSIIGWDEILGGNLNPSATIMSWRGTEPGEKAALAGHDVIMSPVSHAYFDFYQTKETGSEPKAIGGFLPVQKVYEFNPVPETFSESAKKHILGVQANLWTEYIPYTTQAEYMVLPRMAALCEVQWTAPEMKNFDDFNKRALRLSNLYDCYGYQYARHLWKEKQISTSGVW